MTAKMTPHRQIEPHSIIESFVVLGPYPYLDIVIRRWAYLLESTLFDCLGIIFEVEAANVEQMRFDAFSQTVGPHQAIYVFQAEKLPGSCLLLVDNKFAHACLLNSLQDRLSDQPDHLPEITIERQEQLLSVLKQLIRDFERSWQGIASIQLQFQKMVTHRFRAKVIPPFEKCFITKLTVHSHGFDAQIILCFPYLTLDAILQSFPQRKILPPETVDRYYENTAGDFEKVLTQLRYQMSVDLGTVDVNPQKGQHITVGAVFPIHSDLGTQATVKINGNPVLSGVLGNTKNNYSVQVVDRYEAKKAEIRNQPLPFQPVDWSKTTVSGS